MAYVPFNLKPIEDEVDYQQRVQNEILNTRKRLSAVGQDDLTMPPKDDQTLPKIFEYLLRSGHAATGLVSEVLAPGIGETPGEFDPLQALKRGYMGEEKLRTKDILTNWGVSDEPWFDKEILNVRVAPSTAGVAGFVGDVLNPLDPLNWLTFGTGRAAAGTAQGMPLLSKALGQGTAEQVASHLSPEIVGGLKGSTTGDLLNNIINKFPSLTEDQVNNIRGLLNTAQSQGLNLKTKLPTDKKYLTAGLQIPLVNTKVLPQTRIPGTAPVVTSVGNAMNRLGKNKLVDDFKKKFMPGYVSPLDTKDVYKTLKGLEGQPGVEGSTLNEAQDFLQGVVKGTEDSIRYQAGEGEKYLNALFDGMSKDRQSELLYQVSPSGGFTKLFDTYGKSAVDEIQKLGYSPQEALAAKAFHDLRGTIAKTFNDNQIPMDEMWSWVPMILKRKPSTGEGAAIKLAFGGKDYVPQTLDNDLLNLVAKHYPNMLQRQLTFGAGSPHEVNSVLQGTGYKPIAEDHLYNVMSTVNERFIRAVETKKAVDKIINQYGLKPEDLQAGGMRSLPDGYEVFRIATDKNTGKIVFNPVDATEHATFMGGGNVIDDSKGKVFYRGGVKGQPVGRLAEESTIGNGVYLTDDPLVAKGYADIRAGKNGVSEVLETRLKVKEEEILDLSKSDILPITLKQGWALVLRDLMNSDKHYVQGAALKALESLGKDAPLKSMIGGFNAEFTKFLQGKGYKALVASEGGEGAIGEHLSYLVFNPKDLKKVSAKPDKPLDTSTMFAMPKDFARVWQDYQSIHYNESSGALYKFITKATSQFRTLSYMVTPGHIPRDFASNMYNLWLMGMRTPKHLGTSHSAALDLEKNIIFPTTLNRDNPPGEGWSYLVRTASGKLKASNAPVDGEFEAFVRTNRAGNVERRLNKTITTPNGDISMYDVIREANSRGVIDTGWWSTEGPETAGMKAMSKSEKAKSWVTTLNPQKHPWTQFFVRQTKLTDNTSRIMGFVDNLQKGDDLGTAATKIKTYLFDYSELTPFEQKVMRNVIPFYTWLRKNVPLQIKESLKQPGKLATAGKYHEGISEEITPENTPRYLQKQASMLLPGGKSYLTPPMPYQDLGRLPLSLEGMMEQLSNVNPLFRVPVEMAINKKFFSGLPIENYPGQVADKNNGALGELLGQSGVPWVEDKRGLNYILDNIPLYRNVTTMAPLADPRIWGNFNEEVANSPDLTKDYNKLLSFLIGPQLAASGRAKEIATYEERDRLRAIIRLLKDQGMQIPDVRDLE